MFGGQALSFAIEGSDFGPCVRLIVSTMDGLGGGVAEVPWLIPDLGRAGEIDGESFGAAAEVRSVVNALSTASLSASVIVLVGPLGVFVPSETLVGPEGGVIGLFGEMVRVVEYGN